MTVHLGLPAWRADGDGQRLFFRPSTIEAIQNSGRSLFCEPGPFTDGVCDSSKSDVSISRVILHLLKLGRPTTISRPALLFALFTFSARVMPLCICAVNRMFRAWPWPHIGKKLLKTQRPALTDDYSFSSVVRKRLLSLVQAASFYTRPHFVFWALCHPVRFCPAAGFLALPAPATVRLTQITCKNRFFHSTATPTQPIAFPQVGQHRPAKKLLVGNVFYIEMKLMLHSLTVQK
jgi:hypothetical protein